jgi:hypothetical protein
MDTSPANPVLDWWHDYYENATPLDAIETAESTSACSAGRVDSVYGEAVYPGPYMFGHYVGTNFRHSGWQTFRKRVSCAIARVYGHGPSLLRFCHCGESMWLLKSKKSESEFKVVPDNCKSRWCKPCYAARTARLRARLAAKLDDRPVRFITLTVRNQDETLKSALDRLYASFKRLRNSNLWKNRVLGGCGFLEVKRGRNSGFWHPHIHCLVQGRYLPLPDLKKAWLSATGDSDGADVRLVRSREDVLWYVTKYTSKSTGLDKEASDDDLDEIVGTLRGRRTVVPFGEWRSWNLLHGEENEDWELLGHLNELRISADRGDSYIASVLEAMEICVDEKTGIFHLVIENST